MSACVNCPNEAVFQLADPGADALLYCRACLPPHLLGRAASGHLDLPVVEAPKSKAKAAMTDEPQP